MADRSDLIPIIGEKVQIERTNAAKTQNVTIIDVGERHVFLKPSGSAGDIQMVPLENLATVTYDLPTTLTGPFAPPSNVPPPSHPVTPPASPSTPPAPSGGKPAEIGTPLSPTRAAPPQGGTNA